MNYSLIVLPLRVLATGRLGYEPVMTPADPIRAKRLEDCLEALGTNA